MTISNKNRVGNFRDGIEVEDGIDVSRGEYNSKNTGKMSCK
jgi:nucleotidyltransferase/DNA polymerase involved in DNA repair